MASITAAPAGGNWTTGASWLGGVAPTAADDALLVLSSGAITIDSGAVCRSLDCNSYTGTLTHTAAITLTVGDATAGLGNIALRLVSGMTYTKGSTNTSAISFISTSATVQTITCGGKNLGNVTINSSSNGSYQFADQFQSDGNTLTSLTLTKGTLDTNNQTVLLADFNTSNSNVRSLTLGSSAITSSGANGWNAFNSTNLTLSAGTSLITVSSANFQGSTKTYYGISVTSSGAPAVTGAFTCTNFTRTGGALKTSALSLSNNFTVTGTLTLSGNSVTNRLLVQSDVLGTQRTITNTGATMTWSNADFKDIALGTAFDASAITGKSGDAGGNTNITFTTAATQTSTGTASFSWSTHGWTSRVPLPQDDVVINNAFIAGRTVTTDMPRVGKSINWTGATGTPAWAKSSTAVTIYGSVTMIAGMTNTGTQSITMEGRGAFTFTSAGQTFTNPFTVSMFGGTLTMQDAFLSSNAGTHNNGTLDFNNFSSAFTSFNSNNPNIRTLTLGSATMTLNGTSSGIIFNCGNPTNLTLTATTGTIKYTDTGANAQTFAGGAKAYGNLWFSRGASTASITITASNTFTDFKDDGTAAHSILFTTGTTQTVTTFTVSGTAGNLISIDSTTTGTHALTKSGGGTISSDYLNIQHSVASPSTLTWYAGANSTNNQATATAGSGWIFTVPPSGTVFVNTSLMMGV